MILGILIAAGVTFAVASVLLGFGRLEKDTETVLAPDADVSSPAPIPAQAAPASAAPARTEA